MRGILPAVLVLAAPHIAGADETRSLFTVDEPSSDLSFTLAVTGTVSAMAGVISDSDMLDTAGAVTGSPGGTIDASIDSSAGTLAFDAIELSAATAGSLSQTINLIINIAVTVEVTSLSVSLVAPPGVLALSPTGMPDRFAWAAPLALEAEISYEVTALGDTFAETASEMIVASVAGEVSLDTGDLPLQYTLDAEPIALPLVLDTQVELPVFGTTDISVDATATLSGLAATLNGSAAALLDGDGDGILDNVDNCVLIANPLQRDTDFDNIGNACDADISPIPNNCQVDFSDLGALKIAFFSTPASPNWNPDADFDGDDAVGFVDLGRLKDQFFGTPGPSGLPDPCD